MPFPIQVYSGTAWVGHSRTLLELCAYLCFLGDVLRDNMLNGDKSVRSVTEVVGSVAYNRKDYRRFRLFLLRFRILRDFDLLTC